MRRPRILIAASAASLRECSTPACSATTAAACLPRIPRRKISLGLPAAELTGRRIDDFLPVDDLPQVDAEWARFLAAGRLQAETAMVRPDGSLRTVVARARAHVLPGVHLAVLRDITDRIAAEDARRRWEEHFASIFFLSPDGIVISSLRDGRIADVSHAWQRLTGYRREELVGKTVHDLGLYANPADRERLLHEIRAHGAVRDFELPLRTRSGTVRHVLASVTEIVIDREPSLLTVIHDITERKEIEEALCEREDALRQVNEALLAAKNEAERASAAKSQFLSRVSHEFRTPLNAILGFAQLLAMDDLDQDQLESVDHVLSAGRHLLGLIDDVLDVARIEQGRLALTLESVSLRRSLRECLPLLRRRAGWRDIRLDSEGLHGHVLADPRRLQQVLLNLLSNAIKYNRHGGQVRVTSALVAGARWRLAVADTGPGIPPDQLPRLFLPFERLGAEQSGVEGTGLGLAVTEHLVTAMGGRIGVESAVGAGSTFWVELPAVVGPLEPEDAAPLAPEPDGDHFVLCIEDDVTNLELIAGILERRPAVSLLVALRGELGWELARENRPELILLDLHLPDLPGEAVLARLQADPATAAIPVVIITADATPERAARLEAAGVRAYLTKPLDVGRLLHLIDECMAPRPA